MKSACLLTLTVFVLLPLAKLESQGQVFPSEIPQNQQTKQWGLYNNTNRNADIKAPEAWNLYRGDTDNVRIYISDSGLLCTTLVFGVTDMVKHPDLRGGYSQNAEDMQGHGTFVAGIIAALTNNNQGIAGINWNTTINQVNGPILRPINTVLGLEIAISSNAEVLNMSWGVPDTVSCLHSLKGLWAKAYNNDMLLVAATGNDVQGILPYPSKIPGVMAVGSTNDIGEYASYSNWGSGISVVAPGGRFANYAPDVNIYSTGVNHWKDSTWVPPQPETPGYWHRTNYYRPTYKWAGGTSAAAPFVSGVAGLLKGYAKSKGIVLNNDDIRGIIEVTADDNLQYGVGYDTRTGHGKVNAHKALSMLNPPWEMLKGNSPMGGMQASGTFTGAVPYWPYVYTVHLTQAQRFKMTATVNLSRYYYNHNNPESKPYVWIRGAQSNGWHFSPNLCGQKKDASITGLTIQQKNPSYFTAETFIYYDNGFLPCPPDQVNFAYTVIGIPQPPRMTGATLTQISSKEAGPGSSYNLRITWDYAYGCPTLANYEVQRQEPPGTGVWQTFITQVSPYAIAWTVGPMGVSNDFALRMRALHGDGFFSNWSNEYIVRAPVQGDPIVATVQGPEATAYSNGRKIVLDDDGKLHVTYASGDTVYYTASTDQGETWPEKTAVGMGSNPAISLRASEAKTGALLPSICYVSGSGLLIAEKQEAGAWNQPQTVYQGQPDEVISYLSFEIDRNSNSQYAGWVSSSPSGSLVNIAQGSPGGGTLAPTPIDQGGQTAFKSPSLALDRAGNLTAAWSRDGVVRFWKAGEGEIIELSKSGQNAIHPIVETYGDRVSVVWQEAEEAKGLEPGRHRIVSRTRTEYGWGEEKTIAFSDAGDYQYPVAAAAGQYLYAGHHGDGNYDIHYLGDYAGGWETHTRNISINSEGQSGYPCAAFSNKWPEHSLYILWTETFPESSKAIAQPVVKAYKNVIQPVPLLEVYPRTDQTSVYCTQRTGGLCYGAGAYMTVDYHPEELKYRFEGLNPDNRYKVKMAFYRSTGGGARPSNNWLLMPRCDQVSFGTVHLPDTTVVSIEREIPGQCLADGAAEITIKRIKGEYALCAALEIYEYTTGKGGKSGGVQTAGFETPQTACRYELLPCAPNPFGKTTSISYQLAKPGRVTLKVYNTLGQLVRTLEDGERPAGSHLARWDGRDGNGQPAANGVYLYRLEAGEFGKTRKMTLVR